MAMVADVGADAASQRHFRDRHEQAAIGDVVNRADLARQDQLADEIAVALFELEVDRRRRTVLAAGDMAQP